MSAIETAPEEEGAEQTTRQVGSAQITRADALSCYADWPTPTVIVSDGPYGVGGYPGDPRTPGELPDTYEPHVEAWARAASSRTTLWFWGTELSWAVVHPVLARHGWKYRGLHIWDKGLAHIAGNVNGQTIRRFPITTEACAQYVREIEMLDRQGQFVPIRVWFREEWRATGLTLKEANIACGVADAASRKYLTTEDHNWYMPPQEILDKLADYADKHGDPARRPYFAVDGKRITHQDWQNQRSVWNHIHGVTNVWQERAVRGGERMKDKNAKILHSCQKPLRLMEMTIAASSNPGNVVWEPFGGLCSAVVASLLLDRSAYAAEMNPAFFDLAVKRLEESELARHKNIEQLALGE
jgi:hypothetical protein